MKKKVAALALVFSLCAGILTGCSSDGENSNVAEGMSRISGLDYQGALESFEAAMEAGENERLIYRGIGIAYIGLTDYTQAIENLEYCLHLSDGMVEDIDFDVNYYLATAYYKNGDISEAADTYTAILNLRPEEVDAHYLRGTALLALEKYQQAREDFDEVLKLTNGDCNRLIEIYKSLEAHGYQEIGQEYLQKTLNEKGDKLKDYDKGRIYYYLKDYLQACNYL